MRSLPFGVRRHRARWPLRDRDDAHHRRARRSAGGAEGAVGSARLGQRRIFRYEIRRWLNGVIPDTASAKVTTSIELAYADALRLLELVPSVPTSVWGRDELGAGEMWNSNSVTSWLLYRSGVDTSCLAPPDGGRSPGWDAGIEVAARTDTERPVSGRH